MKSYVRAAVLALLTLALLLSFSNAQRNSKPPNVTNELTGWVVCSVCGEKGTTLDGGKPSTAAHAACMRQCVDGGAEIVILVDQSDAVVHLDNPADLKSHFAQRVVVAGYFIDEKFHVLSVRSI